MSPVLITTITTYWYILLALLNNRHLWGEGERGSHLVNTQRLSYVLKPHDTSWHIYGGVIICVINVMYVLVVDFLLFT